MTHVWTQLPGLYNYWVVIVLMMTGLYVVMAKSNLVKKLIGLNIFQVSVIMFYISMGKVEGGTAPVLLEDKADVVYSNPVPHVLMLTAIVVGIATLSLALALVVRLHDVYGTIEEDEILAQADGPAHADGPLFEDGPRSSQNLHSSDNPRSANDSETTPK